MRARNLQIVTFGSAFTIPPDALGSHLEISRLNTRGYPG